MRDRNFSSESFDTLIGTAMGRRAGLFLLMVTAVGAEVNPQPLFEKARGQLIENLQKLPNYTCVETMRRAFYRRDPPYRKKGSCGETDALGLMTVNETLRLSWSDGLRFDVAEGRVHELFSWAGDKSFQAENAADLVESGTIGTGDFGSFLSDVFGRGKAKFWYVGVHREDGADVADFKYEMDLKNSHYVLRSGDMTETIAYSGTFAIDPESGDLRELTVVSTALPEASGDCSVENRVSYHRARIANGEFLLPKTSRLTVVDLSGNVWRNQTEYGACRVYTGETKIRFDEVGDGPETAQAAGPVEAALPAGLRVEIQLTTSIDSSKMLAGDPVEATLAAPLRSKSGVLLAPRGAPVRGRLTRMEHDYDPIHAVAIALRFDSLETTAGPAPLFLKPSLYLNGRPGQGPVSSRSRLANSVTLSFPGEKELRLKQGFITRWETVAPK